jgi:hypothetical protein
MKAALRTAELTPEKLAFINAGTPQSEVMRGQIAPVREIEIAPFAALAPKPPEALEIEAKTAPRQEVYNATKPRVPRERERDRVEPGSLISLSIRVPSDIPKGLLRAATDRKIAGLRPFTQQEIVAEALAHWLKKHGY